MEERFSTSEYYELWVMLIRTADALQALRQSQLRELGISPEQFGTLFAIISLSGPEREGASIADISRLMFRQPHTISEMVKRLEKMGLVQKTKISPTQNNVSVTVTEKGYEVWRSAHDEKASAIAFSTLSKAKRARLSGYLESVLTEARRLLGPNPSYYLRPGRNGGPGGEESDE